MATPNGPICSARLTPNDRFAAERSSAPWTKALVTLVVLAICLGARQIALPTVTTGVGLDRRAMAFWSIMALGVAPLLYGYILVEFAALLVPGWRPLRTGGPAGRAKLHQTSLIVGVLVALGQALVLTFYLEKMGVANTHGTVFRFTTVYTLLGATVGLVALARIVDRKGLGSGFSVLLLAGIVPQIVGPLGNAFTAAQSGAIPSSVLLKGALLAAALVGATLWMFSSYSLAAREPLPHPSLVSRPACGAVPLTVVPGMLLVAAHFARLNHPGQSFGLGSPGDLPTILVLSSAAALLFAFLFNRPDRIAGVWKSLSPNPPEGVPLLKAVLLESVLFIALAVVVQAWLIRSLGRACVPNAVTIMVATGIVCDLVREWRAHQTNPHLTPIWEIHQVYAVAPALRLLKTEGIHAFAKGLRLRSLLQFFGPYVPVQILVPAEQAQEARALLEARWPGGGCGDAGVVQ